MPVLTLSSCDLSYLGCLWPCETVEPIDLFQSPVRPSASYKSAERILTLVARGATNDDEIIKYTRMIFDVVRCDCDIAVLATLTLWDGVDDRFSVEMKLRISDVVLDASIT